VTSLYILEVLSYSKKHNKYTTKNSNLYEYDTRRKENLHVQSYSTLTCEKGVVNMAIKLNNKLTMELRKERGLISVRGLVNPRASAAGRIW
jgi:hypothetical protein